MVAKMDYVTLAKNSILDQSKALHVLAHDIPRDFSDLVEYILKFKGKVVLMGMGKSGYIAKKIAASLASTGTPAFYIHPGEASHGDLGMITEIDMVIMLSNSGETKELFDTINYCKRFNIKIAAITMNGNSTLGKSSDFLLKLPMQQESTKFTEVLITMNEKCLGCAIVLNNDEGIIGIITDGDLRRHINENLGSTTAKDVMTSNPRTIADNALATEAIFIMNQKSITVLPVTRENQLVGVLHIHDILRHGVA